MKERIEKILGTIVSQKILDNLNSKELAKISFEINNCERYIKINKQDLFKEDIDECVEIIKSILNNGKSRINGYKDIPNVKEYLKIKYNKNE